MTKILHNFYYERKEDSSHREEMRLLKAVATMIKYDIKRHDGSKETYPLSSDIVGVDQKLKISSIGQAIMQATRPQVLIAPLQLGLTAQMYHHFGSRFLIDSLHQRGFCSFQSEAQMFERNAVVTSGIKYSRWGLFGKVCCR